MEGATWEVCLKLQLGLVGALKSDAFKLGGVDELPSWGV
jgi:hypothetical protein